jgi:hypothetical protein
MDALGVTQVDGRLYWHGRHMTDEVLFEFIAAAETQAMFPFLSRARESGLRISEIRYDIDPMDEYDITVVYGDENDIICIQYCMHSTAREYFSISTNSHYLQYIGHWWKYFSISTNGRYIANSGDIDSVPFAGQYLNTLAANNKRVVKLEEENKAAAVRIAELEAENSILRAEIAERRLRPGGEDYEMARARFAAQTYE